MHEYGVRASYYLHVEREKCRNVRIFENIAGICRKNCNILIDRQLMPRK
jgi:hypothetical protein